jgi:hypothetical protein
VRGRILSILLLLLIGCAAAAQALAGVSASLSASQVASGDTVQLTLDHDGRTSGQPDLRPLQQDFDILSTTSSTTFSLINGSASLKTEVVLTLAPKVTGILTIPPLSWDGQQTQPLSLTVTGPGGASVGTGQPGASTTVPSAKIFIQTTASPEQPYVESAVRLTVRLFTSETLYRADLELPENGDALVKQIGSDEESNAEHNGRNYRVITRQYLLFPLHSGKLTLQGPVLDAEIAVDQPQSGLGNDPFGGFFGGLRTVRPVRVHGDPIVLAVRARPAGAVGSYWLPARNLTLNAAWNPAQLSAHAGDPVTLDLDLQATGLTAAQLPDLTSLLSFPSGLKAYPDQPKLDDATQNGSLVGSRDQTIALMADSPGRYTIPALTVAWWDTQTNQPRTATLPARTLTILPAPGAASGAAAGIASAGTVVGAAARGKAVAATAAPASALAPAQQSTSASSRSATSASAARTPAAAPSPSEWEWISIGLALVWLATLGAWLWSRRSRPISPFTDGKLARGSDNSSDTSRAMPQAAPVGKAPSPRNIEGRSAAAAPLTPAKERAAFLAACEANNAHAARAHLLAWTAGYWGATPSGINAVAAIIGDANVAQLLRDLDRACYVGGSWQGHSLATALTDLPPPPGSKASRGRDELAPLYPESTGAGAADRPASLRGRRT